MAADAPVRMSHSRLREYLECGKKYDLKRNSRVPERPSLARIGGSAFHEWAQDYELFRLAPSSVPVGSWEYYLETALAEAETESGVDRSDFKVSGRATKARPDKETITVWFEELGPELVELYQAADWGDFTQIATSLPEDPSGNTTGIEYHIKLDAWQGYLDQIRVDGLGNMLVVDLKTWSRKRTTSQLEEYCAAGKRLGLPTVYGAYYTARKGLVEGKHLGKWGWSTFSDYIGVGRLGIEAGYFPPNVGEHCTYCDVSEHCEFAP